MLVEFDKGISQNGRRGLAVLVEKDKLPKKERSQDLYQGTIKYAGLSAGVRTYIFTPDTDCRTYLLCDHYFIEPVEGATLVAREDLQGGSYMSILLLGPTAIVRTVGYKGRWSEYNLYVDGICKSMPSTIMVGLGLLQPEDDVTKVVIEPPPPLTTKFIDILNAATTAKDKK